MPEFFMGQQYTDGKAQDQEIRRFAEEIYVKMRARDTVRVQADVETLIADIKGAILVWMGSGCTVLAASFGYVAPVGAQPTPVTFVASPAAPLNPSF
jgi:hypothetical protein